MKKSRFTEHQVLQAVRDLEAGISAIELGRKLGVSNVRRKQCYDLQLARKIWWNDRIRTAAIAEAGG